MFIVHIAGHLGKDPETRFTPSGQKVTTFNVATNHRKGKEDITIWVRITIWGDRFDKILSFLKKGSAVFVMGKLNPPTSYTDKEGRTQISLEVTAEMIDFSPFGKSDRSLEHSLNGNGQGSQDGSHDDFQAHSSPYQSHKPTYGNAYANVGQGSSQSHVTTIDDDALPF